MMNLFYMGGVFFMGLVSIGLLLVVVSAVRGAVLVFNKSEHAFNAIELIRATGLFSLVLGVLGQMIGLYDAFDAIEAAGSISPALLVGGLKISSITSLYGLIVYTFSLAIWLLLSFVNQRRIG